MVRDAKINKPLVFAFSLVYSSVKRGERTKCCIEIGWWVVFQGCREYYNREYWDIVMSSLTMRCYSLCTHERDISFQFHDFPSYSFSESVFGALQMREKCVHYVHHVDFYPALFTLVIYALFAIRSSNIFEKSLSLIHYDNTVHTDCFLLSVYISYTIHNDDRHMQELLIVGWGKYSATARQ